MTRQNLCKNGWKMRECEENIFYEAAPPCSVLSVLLENHVIEDPYYRENEKKVLPVLEKDYEFITNFSLGGEILSEDEVELVFYGLDTVAEIFLNGKRLSRVRNMHRTIRISVKDKLRMGANELRILFHSPLKFIREVEATPGKEIHYFANGSMPGTSYLRKPHSSFGWDWGPQLPDIGIFRDICIEAYSKVRISEVFIFQEHIDWHVKLYVDPILEYTDVIPVELVVSVSGEPDVTVMTRMSGNGAHITKKGENELTVDINDPQYWWPNGMGPQPLYDVKITVKKADKIYDEKKLRIGLRTLTVSREKDETGEEFCFVINGIKMFAFGADMIPEDAIYSRIDEERIKMLLSSARDANFNCIRIWGGGYYPSDRFYDLCDEYGLIVWQDLMFTCNVYDLTPSFEKSIVAEVKDNVRRLRHHACLGMWSGNNELETAWCNWDEVKNEAPALKADYIKMFEYILPKTVRAEDELTFYWPSSPSSGGCFDDPDDETRGDQHYWDVWHGGKAYNEFTAHKFRFLSEFGFQSFPGLKTVKTYTEPGDRNIFSPVMEAHQKDKKGNTKIMNYISENFRYPKDFEQLIYVSQIMQGITIKTAVEHMRRNRGVCMGTLFWQYNDNWPVASWSAVDYYGRWKMLMYMAKRFYAPVAASICIDGNHVTPWVVNDGMDDMVIRLKTALVSTDGKELLHFAEDIRSNAGTAAKGLTRDLSRQLNGRDPREVYVLAEFEYPNGYVQRESAVAVPYKELTLSDAKPEVSVEETEDHFDITLSAEVFVPFVWLDLKEADARFSDNAFDLHKGRPVVIRIEKSSISGGTIENAEALMEQLQVFTLRDSYV